MTSDKRMEEALELRKQLFDLANGFALDGYGDVAVALHESGNKILLADGLLAQHNENRSISANRIITEGTI